MPSISLDHCPKTLWKNGAGVTQELLRLGEEPFELRFSVAQVTNDGPFSIYPEHDRVLLLLEGRLQLFRTKDNILLNTFEPFYFSGDEVITSKLLTGKSRDFNVIYRKGIKVEVEVLKLDNTFIVLEKNTYVYVSNGQLEYEGAFYSDALFYDSGKIKITTPTEIIVIRKLEKES